MTVKLHGSHVPPGHSQRHCWQAHALRQLCVDTCADQGQDGVGTLLYASPSRCPGSASQGDTRLQPRELGHGLLTCNQAPPVPIPWDLSRRGVCSLSWVRLPTVCNLSRKVALGCIADQDLSLRPLCPCRPRPNAWLLNPNPELDSLPKFPSGCTRETRGV